MRVTDGLERSPDEAFRIDFPLVCAIVGIEDLVTSPDEYFRLETLHRIIVDRQNHLILTTGLDPNAKPYFLIEIEYFHYIVSDGVTHYLMNAPLFMNDEWFDTVISFDNYHFTQPRSRYEQLIAKAIEKYANSGAINEI
jgi:hypothetical protein